MQQKQAWKSFRYRGKYFWVCALEFEASRQVQLNGLLGSVITPTPTLTRTRVNHFEHFTSQENDSIQLTKQRGE